MNQAITQNAETTILNALRERFANVPGCTVSVGTHLGKELAHFAKVEVAGSDFRVNLGWSDGTPVGAHAIDSAARCWNEKRPVGFPLVKYDHSPDEREVIESDADVEVCTIFSEWNPEGDREVMHVRTRSGHQARLEIQEQLIPRGKGAVEAWKSYKRVGSSITEIAT